MRHVTTRLRRGSPPTYADDGSVWVLGQSCVQLGKVDWSRARRHEHSGDARKLKGYLEPGDILINSTGTGTLGRVAYFQGSERAPAIADSHITVIRVEPTQLESRYLYFYLSSSIFQHHLFSNLVHGSTNQIELSPERMGSSPVPLPSLEEQQRIVKFLDWEVRRIEALDEALKRREELLRERFEALLESRIRQATETSPRRNSSLRYALNFFSDGDWIELPYITDSGIRLIQTGNVGVGKYREQGFKYVSSETFRNLRCTEVLPGDVLISRLASPVGRACLAPQLAERMIASVDVVICRTDPAVLNPKFLVNYLSTRTHLAYADLESRGSTMQRLSRSQLGGFAIPLPSLDEQHEAVAHIDGTRDMIDRIADETARNRALLAERRQALVTAAVSGDIDVATARAADV